MIFMIMTADWYMIFMVNFEYKILFLIIYSSKDLWLKDLVYLIKCHAISNTFKPVNLINIC